MKRVEVKSIPSGLPAFIHEPVAGSGRHEFGAAAIPPSARRLRRWWNQFWFGLWAIEHVLARHHRLGWHADLDRAVQERGVRQLKSRLRAEGS